MLVLSTVQAGFGTNFVHFLVESSQHIAWLVSTCMKEEFHSIEATPEAEDAWIENLWGIARGLAQYSAVCTPGYYNSEGVITSLAARNVTYPGNLLRYIQELHAWRKAGGFAGARVVPSKSVSSES